MKRYFFCFCLLLISSVLFASTNLSVENYFYALIGKENYNKLLKEGEVTSVFKKKSPLPLMPSITDRESLLRDIREINPVAGVEILLMLESDGEIIDDQEKRLDIYNTLHAISTLKGLEYYSFTRKKMRIFFHDAFVIGSPRSKKPLPDPRLSELKPVDQLFAFLNDSTFGKYPGIIQYTTKDEYISMDIVNPASIKQFFVPVVSPGNLRVYLALFPYKDRILFYGFTCVNTINLFGIASKYTPSFFHRLRAMFNWFTEEMKKPD